MIITIKREKIMRKLKLDEFNKTSGTSYQGSVMTSLSNLKNIFEAPSVTYADIDSKTRNEYLIEFDDGLVATIYDYKEYRAYDDDEILEFHIGGFNALTVSRIQNLLS